MKEKIKIQKGIFKKENYTSFMLGVFVLGGLLVVPLLWSFLLGLRYVDMFLKPYVVFSLMLCVCVLIVFRRDGTTSWLRIIPAIIIGIIVGSAVAAASGKLVFGSSTIIGFLILILCGRVGVEITKLFYERKNWSME